MLVSSLLICLSSLAAAQSLIAERAISGCYPLASNSTGDSSSFIKTSKSPQGFVSAARGWNSWGIQANPRTIPGYSSTIAPYVNQSFIIEQCTVLSGSAFVAAGYDLCSIDDYWDSTVSDEYGRITYNATLFDMPTLATKLHDMGLKLGLYARPSAPCDAANKTISNTDILVGSLFISGLEDARGNCYLNYSNPDTQLWHNALIDLWASWGVDMIKLDFLTPGSIIGSLPIPDNTSAAAIAYHDAITNNGRQIRLDLSSNVCRNEPYLGIWKSSADSFRIAVDINSSGAAKFLGSMWKVQGTIEQYRQYINLLVAAEETMSLHPDFDNMFVGNPESVSGVTDAQRITIASHWIGASANLILGSDMTNIDDLGLKLATSQESIEAAKFCGRYPMQPRNPGTGSNQPMQLQAWIAGPDDDGQAYVLLTNLGANLGRGGYVDLGSGLQNVSITLGDLGLTGSGYVATDVWFGNVTTVEAGGGLSALLDDGNSQFLRLTLATQGST
ncbi:hypothetical protein PFICI_15134 [Pestalotiopsis fici W106-1]|uniref:alpha-galactosidase n=1 Tax=Pestalotiopsis fici (strain W106-1 / CGMCC3.15140) TaxID=1229662 RepID=W3WHC1_PESFW|nr:uncharacterized protein PFICI_15134 [Pestalotiopsis fici W106-1]ETS73189.1 hypothetical protein PFICI_15134 [Pestalotiopsis fici W106-1]